MRNLLKRLALAIAAILAVLVTLLIVVGAYTAYDVRTYERQNTQSQVYCVTEGRYLSVYEAERL